MLTLRISLHFKHSQVREAPHTWVLRRFTPRAAGEASGEDACRVLGPLGGLQREPQRPLWTQVQPAGGLSPLSDDGQAGHISAVTVTTSEIALSCLEMFCATRGKGSAGPHVWVQSRACAAKRAQGPQAGTRWLPSASDLGELGTLRPSSN